MKYIVYISNNNILYGIKNIYIILNIGLLSYNSYLRKKQKW